MMNDEDIDYEDMDDLPITDHVEWRYFFSENDMSIDTSDIERWVDE